MNNYDLASGNKEEILMALRESIHQLYAFSPYDCRVIESLVLDVVNEYKTTLGNKCTVDKTLLRNKYFFGERYTYGSQLFEKGRGMEKLYPKNSVDPIPQWIYDYVIDPLVKAKVIEKNFVNSVVINEYQPGGCIVSHIDPPHIFDRPIISVSLMSDSTLCFGCKFEFKPIRCSEPVLKVPLPRGIVTSISGYAANNMTHCVRPEDTKDYRIVILLRRVLPDAPRLLELDSSTYQYYTKVGNNKIPGLSSEVFRKFCSKYSKSIKKTQFGGISKHHSKKPFFDDDKDYAKQAYGRFVSVDNLN